MIRRTLERKLRESARRFPVVTLTGPRQSGKTTLARAVFPRHDYVSLELPDERAFAREDPRGFLARFSGPVILDEVRRVPDLFSYIQVLVDEDRSTRGRFVRLCAERCGQLVNLSGLASDCGISHSTARRWLSVLEASFIVFLLRPHYRNFGKRLVKTPKLYFLDTGLLCYLLQVRRPEELFHRAERGAVFESFVVSELLKNFVHRGEQPSLWFWRDGAGHEIDVLVDLGRELVPVEVRSAATFDREFLAGIAWWRRVAGLEKGPAALVYGGDRGFRRDGVVVYPWFVL